MDWSFLEKVVYINLERSLDRNERMKEVLKPFGDKVIRFNAVDIPEKGHIGCAKSHIGVLEMAIENKWKNVLILEDDIKWNHTEIGYKNLKTLLENSYDVILLGGTYSVYDNNTYKLSQSCWTGAYIIKQNYYHTLLNVYKRAYSLLQRRYINNFYIDTIWWILMKKDNWYIIIPNLLYETEQFSYIDNKIMNRIDKFNL